MGTKGIKEESLFRLFVKFTIDVSNCMKRKEIQLNFKVKRALNIFGKSCFCFFCQFRIIISKHASAKAA